MSRFENKLCPVCRERFRDGDDIAVCPECGTPHHRACYLKQNKCGLDELHAEGYVWNGRLPDEPLQSISQSISAAASASSSVPEPVERKTNNLDDDPGADDASVPETSDDTNDNKASEDQTDKKLEIFGLPDPNSEMFSDMGLSDPIRELYKMISDDSKGEDGVSMQELIAYTGTSIWHYSRAFRSFREPKGKRHVTSFNLCSGLFSPIFQFYRKMDLLGVVLLVISVLPVFLIITMSGGAAAAIIVNDDTKRLLSLINIVETVLLCLFGDYLFYKMAVRRILKVRKSFEGDTDSVEYLRALSESGRPSFARAALGCLALLFANACILAISGGRF
ncbi:MAG: hypothetical protein K2N56_13110 [Oscillospiraceae bacterium]|nr:hypothetical protein [Oscillospiraceae bacterium]